MNSPRPTYRPTVLQCVQAIADAMEYWEAQEIELFLFGATADQEDEALLFAEAA